MIRRRVRPPSVVLSETTAAKTCGDCHGTVWFFSTNGDGSSVQCCTNCGVCVPFGRHYQDPSVGVRVIAHSWWSALHVHPKKT